ncbi:MAG: NFACT family protein [Clostridia bacterium]|nr:NFACT family protein [Clostridia bacterium]
MAFDGITCDLLTNELNRILTGARIDKIYMPDKYTVILNLRGITASKLTGFDDETISFIDKSKLLICFAPSNPRINLTDKTRENPAIPPSFCMLLRKYLSGAHITSVVNPGVERILEINISTINELRDVCDLKLTVELMGRYSNLILINQHGKIIDSAIHIDYSINRVREVMPARIYEYPPVQNKIIPYDIEDIFNGINTNLWDLISVNDKSYPILISEQNRPLSKALLNSIKGLSPLLVQAIISDADIDDRMTPNMMKPSEAKRLEDSLLAFCKSIKSYNGKSYVYYSDTGDSSEFSPIKLNSYSNEAVCGSLSEAIELYNGNKDRIIDIENKKNRLRTIVNNALSKVLHKQEQHKSDVDEGLKADIYKKYGDLILSNIYRITDKCDSVQVEDYYEEGCPLITIPLDVTLNSNDNAQDYYKRFRKAKRKLELSSTYLEDDNQAIFYLRTLKTAIDAANSVDDINAIDEEIQMLVESSSRNSTKVKKENLDPNRTVGMAKSGKASSRALRAAAQRAKSNSQKNKKDSKKSISKDNYRKFLSTDGHVILCGRNNIQNDNLTFSVANKEDWWFHIKGLPGTHVILQKRIDEDIPSDSSVIEAASIAAYFSRSTVIEEHSTQDLKVEIDYCPVSHVKKIPKAKPGMVIYEGYYSINVVPVITSKEQ